MGVPSVILVGLLLAQFRGPRTPLPACGERASCRGHEASPKGDGEGVSTEERRRRQPLTLASLRYARVAPGKGCDALSPQVGRGVADVPNDGRFSWHPRCPHAEVRGRRPSLEARTGGWALHRRGASFEARLRLAPQDEG